MCVRSFLGGGCGGGSCTHLQRGTGQLGSTQLLACKVRRHHIFLQCGHPPVTLSWQCTACWNSARTLRQLLLLQLLSWQLQACFSSSMVRCSCTWRWSRST